MPLCLTRGASAAEQGIICYGIFYAEMHFPSQGFLKAVDEQNLKASQRRQHLQLAAFHSQGEQRSKGAQINCSALFLPNHTIPEDLQSPQNIIKYGIF